MRAFVALERFFERFFERPSARIFRAHLEPVAVLRRIERTMDTDRHQTTEGTLVPDRYTVRLHPADLAALTREAPTLPADLADGALRFAKAHGYRLRARPRIDLVPDPRIASGDLVVEGRIDEGAANAGRSSWSSAPVGGAPHTDGGGSALVPVVDQGGPVGDATAVYRPPKVVGPIARLRVLDPTGGDRTVPIDGGLLTVGRDPDNDVVLADVRASRHHLRLQGRQGTLVLVDLGSRNGTLVNGVPVAEVAIGIGDEIRIGDTRLIVEALPAA
jgi:hypothetical protein